MDGFHHRRPDAAITPSDSRRSLTISEARQAMSPQGARSLRARFAFGFSLALALPMAAMALTPAGATEVVVAIGASNTSGFGVGAAAAYPARLEALLRACGHDVRIVNAGVSFETTHGMLARLERDVPAGARAVIIQPGGNDRRFFVSRKQRTQNIEAMRSRLAARGIPAIVYDPVFPREAYQWDGIHLSAARHAAIAAELAPRIASHLGGRRGPGCG